MNTQPSSASVGRAAFVEGRGGLPMLEITTPWSSAEIYLHGAHVTHFQGHGQPPLLFLSQCSRFQPDAPIRGGIPIIFPWFGRPAGKPAQHGFARVREWRVREIHSPADGSVTVRLALPECPDSPDCPACAVEYVISVGPTLGAELRVMNRSARPLVFENCLHTYFAVGDIAAVAIKGLTGVEYLDATANFARHTDRADMIHIAGEVDRVYLDTAATVEIHDRALRRVIRVDKENSLSTVVWNPWIAKAKAMPDFGDEEYKQMVCVESGNVADNRLTLAPGETHALRITLSSAALD